MQKYLAKLDPAPQDKLKFNIIYKLRKILLFERSRELFQRRLLDSPAKLGRSKNNCASPVIIKLTNLLLIVIFNFALLTFNSRPAGALTMSNDNYIIQMGTLGTAAGKPTSDSYKMGVSVGQTAPGLYTGTNYKVRAGFQYIHSIIAFRFSITETSVDFGIIEAGNPVTRTHSLIVSNGSAYGYSVYATESAQLRVPALGAIIPDTTCDDGNCTESTSGPWVNNQDGTSTTYGFGYRCDNETGTDCVFTTANYFKQFADSSKNETPQAVMSGTNVGKNKRVRITYKVNVSATQPAGQYINIISYVATPTF